MIREAFDYLTTPCPRWARRLGYLTEAIAIEARYRRCAKAWAPHLTATQDTILRAVRSSQIDSIVILGSGAGLDVPLEGLVECAPKIDLVDAVHPKVMRRRLERCATNVSVSLTTQDLTGTADALLLRPTELPAEVQPTWRPSIDGKTLVVSLNLLSQLPLRALTWVGRHQPVSDKARVDFADAVMRSHIGWLRTLGCPSLVVAEVNRSWSDNYEGESEIEPVASRAGLPEPEQTWPWQTIPPGERDDGLTLRAEIGVWRLS